MLKTLVLFNIFVDTFLINRKLKMLLYIINVFPVTFDHFNEYLLNKSMLK